MPVLASDWPAGIPAFLLVNATGDSTWSETDRAPPGVKSWHYQFCIRDAVICLVGQCYASVKTHEVWVVIRPQTTQQQDFVILHGFRGNLFFGTHCLDRVTSNLFAYNRYNKHSVVTLTRAKPYRNTTSQFLMVLGLWEDYIQHLSHLLFIQRLVGRVKSRVVFIQAILISTPTPVELWLLLWQHHPYEVRDILSNTGDQQTNVI